jgi:hypothetical protein
MQMVRQSCKHFCATADACDAAILTGRGVAHVRMPAVSRMLLLWYWW